MKQTQTYLACLLVFLLVMAIVSYHNGRSDFPAGRHPGKIEVEASPRKMEPSIHTTIRNHRENAQDDALSVNTERAVRSLDYLMKVQKSNAIRQYLDAPRRDDPEYQSVLISLLEHGYGIEQWAPTCSLILAWQMPIFLTTTDLQALGYSGETLEKKLQEHIDAHQDFKQSLLRTAAIGTGINDLGYVEELMDIPLRVARNEAPFGYSGVTATQGERLLSDADWMNKSHLAAQERYHQQE